MNEPETCRGCGKMITRYFKPAEGAATASGLCGDCMESALDSAVDLMQDIQRRNACVPAMGQRVERWLRAYNGGLRRA